MRIRNLRTGAINRPEDLMQDVAEGLNDGSLTIDDALRVLHPLGVGDPEQLQEVMGQVGVDMPDEVAIYFAKSRPPEAN